MNALSIMAQSLVRAGIRARLPRASEMEVEAEHYRIVFGEELAQRVLDYKRRVRAGNTENESG